MATHDVYEIYPHCCFASSLYLFIAAYDPTVGIYDSLATCWWTFALFPGLDREGNSTSLQYSCLENPMEAGVWWAVVHGVTKSRTRLSDFTFTFHFHALEKEMATHSSVVAWRIPGMGEPRGLPFMGSHRVGHDWSNLAAAAV